MVHEGHRKHGDHGGERVIVEYSGAGAQSPRPFTADGPWEAQWEADGAFFMLSLHDAQGRLVELLGNAAPAAPGAAYFGRAGTYALQISGTGAWRVRVVAVE